MLVFAASYMSLKYFSVETLDQLTQPDLSHGKNYYRFSNPIIYLSGATADRGYITANLFTGKNITHHRQLINIAKGVTVEHFQR